MEYKEIINDFLRQGLIKKQEINFVQIEKLILRAQKDLIVAKANLEIDEEVVDERKSVLVDDGKIGWMGCELTFIDIHYKIKM